MILKKIEAEGVTHNMAAEKKQVLTVKNIRNVNTENILQSIIRNNNTTRSILAKENNISLMTVKHVVDDLIAAGFLVEKNSSNADVGRNPKVLEMTEEYGNIVCVNLTSEDEISFLIYDIYQNLLTERCLAFSGQDYKAELLAVIKKIKEEHNLKKWIVRK